MTALSEYLSLNRPKLTSAFVSLQS